MVNECGMKIVVMLALLVVLGSASDKKSTTVPLPMEKLTTVPLPVKKISKKNLDGFHEENFRRILGGSKAPEGKFPFMVFLFIYYSGCSASLIKPRWVLSAAHCIPSDVALGPESFVVGGTANLTAFFVEKIQNFFQKKVETEYGVIECLIKEFYIHPEFNIHDLAHDITLILLEEPMMGPTIGLIPLSRTKMEYTQYCTIMGFGLLGINRSSNYNLYYKTHIESGTFPRGRKCPKKEDKSICLVPGADLQATCYGDSGSPLVFEDKVWGVLSHVTYHVKCHELYAVFYAAVFPDLEWLLSVCERNCTVARTSTFYVLWIVSVGFKVSDFFI